MKKGYYTNPQGHVLGYWELPDKPKDTEQYIWVESDSKPELFVSEEEAIARKKVKDNEELKKATHEKLKVLGFTDDEITALWS